MRAATVLLAVGLACGGSRPAPSGEPAPVTTEPVDPVDRVPAAGADAGPARPVSGQPIVEVGTPTTRGDLTPEVVRGVIVRDQERLVRCYETEIAANLELAGIMIATFKITTDGSVYSANAAGVDEDMADCAVEVLSSLRFPQPRGGAVEVSVSLDFRRAP